MRETIRETRSICPLCGKNLPAVLTRDEAGAVYLERTCPEHGAFSVPVWRGDFDFDAWIRGAEPLGDRGQGCPGNCGLCPEHESESCCVLLEVTRRCDLNCRFCFAQGGAGEDIPAAELRSAIRDIAETCGGPLLQLSGGEPTLRDDLPELAAWAKEAGCSFVQVNTNGLRLAREPEYARRLSEAGADILFLQFDGTREDIYKTLRGRPLLEAKKAAVQAGITAGLGVTLVPTVVPGVNDDDLGDLVRFAASLAPGVRGVHFQPVSYFGRYPSRPEAEDRYTLDRLMADLCRQLGVEPESFMPSRCDHPLCGFHARYLIGPGGKLQALSNVNNTPRTRGTARENREFVARQWRKAEPAPRPVTFGEDMDFDTFLTAVRQGSLTLSAMAFQDALNLNIERLHRCSLHVYDGGRVQPFCARYLTLMEAVE